MNNVDYSLLRFLQESNYIEDVRDGDSLNQALKAWRYIIKFKKLSIKNILETHRILMLHQPIDEGEKGNWRACKVWIGGREGRPWFALPELMENWVRAINNSIKSEYVKTEDQRRGVTVAMHVDFEFIHPFIDGNGRMGRILLNWHLMRLAMPILVITEAKKHEYYRWFSTS